MPTDSIPTSRIPPAKGAERTAELLLARRTLMCQLEASLHGSRKALLALDLAGIERGTREQVSLMREFEAVLRRGAASPAIGSQPAKDGVPGLPAGAPAWQEELRRCENRVREAARLQAALLVRARCKLHVLANMLAGPSVTYERLLAGKGAPRFVCASQQASEARGSI